MDDNRLKIQQNMEGSGFYKMKDGVWYYAENFVYHKDYTLERDGNREGVDGWNWYDTVPEEYLIWLEKLNRDELI